MEVYVVRLLKNHSSVVGTEFYRVDLFAAVPPLIPLSFSFFQLGLSFFLRHDDVMEVYVVRLMKNRSSVVGTEFYRVLARIVVIFLFVSDSYLV